MRHRQRHCAMIVGLLLGMALLTGCQKGLFGDVDGKIVEVERGQPIQGAEVRIEKVNVTARTDAEGVFHFKRVPVGVYALVCSKPNSYFRETTIPNFRIRTDSVTQVTLALEVKASLIFEDRKEPVALTSLKTDCNIFRGRYGLTNDPRAPLTSLVLVRRDDKKILSKYGGLQGSVIIGSEDQALELARLFTDLKTFAFFHELSHDNEFIEVRTTEGKPGLGEIAAERAKKLGIVAPLVTATDGGYTITRFVMSLAQNLYRIRERVGYDGEYAVLEKTLIIPKMDIIVPAS